VSQALEVSGRGRRLPETRFNAQQMNWTGDWAERRELKGSVEPPAVVTDRRRGGQLLRPGRCSVSPGVRQRTRNCTRCRRSVCRLLSAITRRTRRLPRRSVASSRRVFFRHRAAAACGNRSAESAADLVSGLDRRPGDPHRSGRDRTAAGRAQTAR